MFVTQQGLRQQLTMELLDRLRNPEKLRSCVSSEEDDMEVGQRASPTRTLCPSPVFSLSFSKVVPLSLPVSLSPFSAYLFQNDDSNTLLARRLLDNHEKTSNLCNVDTLCEICM